ncbi:MAG TPA: transglutaminase domain-containing protein [Candidatus Acidoferrales bacterium]
MREFTRSTGILGAFLILMFTWKGFSAETKSTAAHSSPAAEITDSSQRRFEFTYQVRVPDLPASPSPLRIWIPVPTSDTWQTITSLAIESPIAHRITKENQFGNSMAYFDVKLDHARPAFDIAMRFTAVRMEHRVDLSDTKPNANSLAPSGIEFARFLQPDHLVPIDGVIGELSKEHTQGAATPEEKARKIYEYVIATMRYDKSGTGWGHGDAIWACTAKRGNCTDFHSLFDGMARATGIPARFEIGFPLPIGKSQDEISGYHCWTEFYLRGVGWVPIDASEAWKNPAKHDYLFGANDANRIQFSMGRDIRLNPSQQSDALNYFVYPYAELNGKPFDQLQSHFAFQDLPATEPSASAINSSK